MTTQYNPSLEPIAADQRVFSGYSHASLWFSLGVGLLVIQVGAYLVPAVGTRDALWAVLIGSVLGSGLLAWTAKVGCDSGLSSAGLIHRVFGRSFGHLPVLLNIVQLVGWTTFELVVMRDGMQAIVHQVTGADVPPVVGTLIWGGVLTLLMTGSMLTLVRRFVSRIGLPLVILSLLWLSWHFLGVAKSQGFQAFLDAPGDGSMSLASAIDLVIAMPVSWLPLVADYARHGRSGGTTLRGTWFGYTVANIWCYALGVLVARVTAPGTELLSALLLAQGGLLALGLILLDELDNAYGDTYSAAVSTSSTLPKWTVRQWGIATALLSTFLGCLLPMHSLEPFLLTLSSVFVPLFGVILGRLGWGQHGNNPISRTIDGYAVVIWLFGIAIFHGLATWAPEMGSALPSLTFTFVLASFTRHSDRGACAAC